MRESNSGELGVWVTVVLHVLTYGCLVWCHAIQDVHVQISRSAENRDLFKTGALKNTSQFALKLILSLQSLDFLAHLQAANRALRL